MINKLLDNSGFWSCEKEKLGKKGHRTTNPKDWPTIYVSLENFNKVLKFLGNPENEYKKGLPLTENKNVSTNAIYLKTGYDCWDIEVVGGKWVLYFIGTLDNDEKMVFGCFKIMLKSQKSKEKKEDITGSYAFQKFKYALEQDGVDIWEQAITDGETVKKLILPPLIELGKNAIRGKCYTNVFHIDLNSAYQASAAERIPEWKNTIEKLYNERNENPINKQILNRTQGFFQSKYCILETTKEKYPYALSHISADMIKDTRDKLLRAADYLESKGYTILVFNTDGIWYQGEYEPDFDKEGLGEFKTDHIAQYFRIKTAGAFEYIENFKYKAVIRGRCKLDEVEEGWRKGDITNWGKIFFENAVATVIKYDPVLNKIYEQEVDI